MSEEKPPLLFAVHRIPYPPNKGDKIRSFNILKHLSSKFRVFLVTFIDDPNDWVHCATLRSYCADMLVIDRTGLRHRLRAAVLSLLNASSLTVSFYYSPRAASWAKRMQEKYNIRNAIAFCSPMVQLLIPSGHSSKPYSNMLIDFVDVDSEKWRELRDSSSGMKRCLYKFEAGRLLNWERRCASIAEKNFFVSKEEAELFVSVSGVSRGRVGFYSNGVNTEYFSTHLSFPSPYSDGELPIAFTGAMNYAPNVDAAVWFAKLVWPTVLSAVPRARFWIVGAKPTKEVEALSELEGVRVTGTVEDIRPYLKHARLAVAPVRIARGIQNKVLEAMAMGRAVVATPGALEGIELGSDARARVAIDGTNDPLTFADQVMSALLEQLEPGKRDELEGIARNEIEERCVWPRRLETLDRHLV